MRDGPQFQRYIGIDYSGAATATTRLPGLRIFVADRDLDPVEERPAPDGRTHWTRAGVADFLARRVREGIPTIMGIDHGLSFPAPYFQRHGLHCSWREFLADFCSHCPADSQGLTVRDITRRPDYARGGERSWLRATEERAGGAKSVFWFDVNGEVATSTHAGLPWLRHLSEEADGLVHFWPFDGWRVPGGRSVVAEVYPALFRSIPAPDGLSGDQRDAYVVAQWLRRSDQEGTLLPAMAPSLPDDLRERAGIEGWILGVGSEGEPRARQRDVPRALAGDVRAEGFPPGVAEKLKIYVYRLIDPRNGETFYVGKGKGDRVFAHIRLVAAIEGDETENKVKRIREIHLAGFEVAHVIHRHGLDDHTAFEVEAALIDAYPGLTNIAGGAGSDFGAMHAKEIVARYAALPAVFQHRALLIGVNRSASEVSLYDAVRYAWKIDREKARQAEVILATVRGMIVGAFVAHEWLEAKAELFPGLPSRPGRSGFHGAAAPPELASLYVGKRVPDEYRKAGAANPVKYTWR